jgi:tRNA dimethylallyltransferase
MILSDNAKYDIIVITGPTASGKTALAAALATAIGGEVVSADSRQVYRRMDIGTGKDLHDYVVDGYQVPYHLIDILEPGEKYNVFEYQHDFLKVFRGIKNRKKMPVICGGSGMYLDSVVSGYNMFEVPPDTTLRKSLGKKSMKELIDILTTYKELHNITDIDSKKRVIRAIEIAHYHKKVKTGQQRFPRLKSLIIGIDLERELRRKRISNRLMERLENGLVEEVRSLMSEGLEPESLIYYGLEYKYVTNYIIGKLSYEEMISSLEIAIHQFAKRQMTWFRGMERRGIKINWIDGSLSTNEKLSAVERIWAMDQSYESINYT